MAPEMELTFYACTSKQSHHELVTEKSVSAVCAIIDEKCCLKGTECKNNFKLESASGTSFLQKKVD